LQHESITRTFGAVLASLVAIGAAEPVFVDAPAHLALFAPRAESTSYRTGTSTLSLDQVLTALADDDSLGRPPGAWQPRHELPQDAFGDGGAYNRWALRRLYGAVQPRVARGPRIVNGQTTEAWILISPFPDPSFTRLEPGTLRIIVAIPGRH
jgi:hypothetical protein